MQPVERARVRERTPQQKIWSREVEAALARGECTALDPWIAQAVNPFGTDTSTDPCDHNLAACIFSALFFRLPDHPHLARWAERARDNLVALPNAARLTLARRLLRYDLFFGRPARAALLMDTLRAQGIERARTPITRLQWLLLQAIHDDSRGAHADCLDTVHRAQEFARRRSIPQWSTKLRALEVAARLGLNDRDAARRVWEAPYPEKSRDGLLGTAHMRQLGAQLALAEGNATLALEHAGAALRAATRTGAPLFHALACLAVAEVHIERGVPRLAEPALHQAEKIAHATGSAQLASLCAFLRAYRAFSSRASADAENDLRLGFGLASRHGYQNFFWWSPHMMTALCIKALERGVETNYVQEFVRFRRLMPTATPVHVEAWPWPVKVYALGRFALLIDNQPVRTGRKAQHKPLELLKVLIAQGGRDVGEDSLTATLWPDAEGDAARQAFDTTLHRLRKLLGNEQAIMLRDRKLSLDNRYCWTDVWAFERSLSEAETILGNPSADPDGVALAQCAGRVQTLYHGHFLGKEPGTAWSITLRERLRSRYLRHVAGAGARWQQLDRWDRAIECYRKGLEVDDLAEQLYQSLMLCHQKLGQRSEALAVYRRCRFVLSVVLGITPSPATESLHQRLRSGS